MTQVLRQGDGPSPLRAPEAVVTGLKGARERHSLAETGVRGKWHETSNDVNYQYAFAAATAKGRTLPFFAS